LSSLVLLRMRGGAAEAAAEADLISNVKSLLELTGKA
jgi:hypothetical protein